MTIIHNFLPQNLAEMQALARAARVYVPSGGEELLLVASVADAVQGFAAWQCVLDEATLLGIAVAPDARRQGIGARILQESEAQLTDAKSFFLEVRAGNHGAQALYRAHGYREIARRAAYYGDEDALIFSKERQ